MSEIIERFFNALSEQDQAALESILNSSPNVWAEFDKDDDSLLHHLAAAGWSDGLRVALRHPEASSRINLFNNFSWTPLIQAVKAECFKCVEILLDFGADVNAHEESRIGNTALIEAVDLGNEKIVKLLLRYGAKANIRGWMQCTAIDKALRRTEKSQDEVSQRILKLLIRR